MSDADALASIGVLTIVLGPPLVIIVLGLRYARSTSRIRDRFAGTSAAITGSRVAERKVVLSLVG